MKTIDRDTGRLGLQQRKGKPGVVYLLAGQRDQDGKDVQQIRVMKDVDGSALISEKSVLRSLKGYFEELMNAEYERERQEDR